MILFAGIAAEALVYGEAEGGENDENLFRSLCILLNPPLSVAQVCIPLNVPLRYPLRFGGSQSYILDPSPSVEPSSIGVFICYLVPFWDSHCISLSA